MSPTPTMQRPSGERYNAFMVQPPTLVRGVAALIEQRFDLRDQRFEIEGFREEGVCSGVHHLRLRLFLRYARHCDDCRLAKRFVRAYFFTERNAVDARQVQVQQHDRRVALGDESTCLEPVERLGDAQFFDFSLEQPFEDGVEVLVVVDDERKAEIDGHREIFV